MRVVLREDAFDSGADESCLVEGWRDDGEEGRQRALHLTAVLKENSTRASRPDRRIRADSAAGSAGNAAAMHYR